MYIKESLKINIIHPLSINYPVMKPIGITMFVIAVIATVACSKPATKASAGGVPQTKVYENELFSIEIPNGWTCDTSNWEGLAGFKNVVDIYDPAGGVMSLHIVKTFMPALWKDIYEAKDMAFSARMLSGDKVELIYEQDSIEVGGYPAYLLVYENSEKEDHFIQKQFVTFLQDSHIVVYFNEMFYVQDDIAKAQEIGDRLISTISLKKVVNPLLNDSVFREAADKGIKKHPVKEQYLQQVKKQ